MATPRSGGLLTVEGAPRYRIDWDEAGRTWEADGAPFAGLQAMTALLADDIVDDQAWAPHVPTGLRGTIRSHPDKSVSWYEGEPVKCFPLDYQPGGFRLLVRSGESRKSPLARELRRH